MKTIIFIFILSLSLHADYLLGHLERCTSDYYYKYDTNSNKDKLYYLNARTGNWKSTSTNVGFIYSGYEINSNGECVKKTSNFGLTDETLNFMYAMLGLFFGMTLFWIVPK